jgi:hypothetical protein
MELRHSEPRMLTISTIRQNLLQKAHADRKSPITVELALLTSSPQRELGRENSDARPVTVLRGRSRRR